MVTEATVLDNLDVSTHNKCVQITVVDMYYFRPTLNDVHNYFCFIAQFSAFVLWYL